MTTWVRLDDNYPNHPKVMSLSSDAVRLHITCICYASQYLTDGVIATKIAEKLGSEEFYVELLDSKLIERTESGWLLSSYLEYQSSKEEVETAKRKNKERLSKWRQKQSGNTITDAVPNKPVTNYKCVRNGVRNADVTEPHTPVPVPTHTHTHTPTPTPTSVHTPTPTHTPTHTPVPVPTPTHIPVLKRKDTKSLKIIRTPKEEIKPTTAPKELALKRNPTFTPNELLELKNKILSMQSEADYE